MRPDVCHHFQTIFPGHLNIGNDQIWLKAKISTISFYAIFSGNYLHAFIFQYALNDVN